jgi:hypothetical protein
VVGDGGRGAHGPHVCMGSRGAVQRSAASVEGSGNAGKRLERRGREGRGKQEAWGVAWVVPCLCVQHVLARVCTRPGCPNAHVCLDVRGLAMSFVLSYEHSVRLHSPSISSK